MPPSRKVLISALATFHLPGVATLNIAPPRTKQVPPLSFTPVIAALRSAAPLSTAVLSKPSAASAERLLLNHVPLPPPPAPNSALTANAYAISGPSSPRQSHLAVRSKCRCCHQASVIILSAMGYHFSQVSLLPRPPPSTQVPSSLSDAASIA